MRQRSIFYIDDARHAEHDGPFDSFEAAIAELRRRASVAWDSPPNKAPCTSWRTCGREYRVSEQDYDPQSQSWRRLQDVHVLDVSAEGVRWIEGLHQAWDGPLISTED